MISPRAIFANRELLKKWRKLSGYHTRKLVKRGRKVDLIEYEIPVRQKELDGKTIFFFSDLHWNQSYQIGKDLVDLCETSIPNWVICGGDLISYSCFLNSALDLVKKLKSENTSLAVLGNWDKKRWQWFSLENWRKCYAKIGFKLLNNEESIENGIRFWGADDFKIGSPKFIPPDDNSNYSLMISHNPDTVVEINDALSSIDLILCGHTHAGQIRIPWLGALRTSSRYWRKFDCGEYLNTDTGTRLIISAGLGCTGVDFRLFSRREATLIRFVHQP